MDDEWRVAFQQSDPDGSVTRIVEKRVPAPSATEAIRLARLELEAEGKMDGVTLRVEAARL